jgi:hypothetical protein
LTIPFLSALFVILTSPYPENPASALGHVLLLEADSSKPYPLWNTVGYMADISDANRFTYTKKGVFGGFPAYYEIIPFYDKIEQYSDIENRDLWLYPLWISDEELKRFKDTLSIWAEQEYPYMFFNLNCVDGIYNILKKTLDSIPEAPPVLTPQNFVELLGKGGRLGNPVHFRSGDSISPEYSKYNLPHKYNRFDFGIGFESEFYFQFNFMPLLHSLKDRSFFYTPFIEFEILSLNMNFNRENFKIKKFWLLKMQSLSPQESISWLFNVGRFPRNIDMGIGQSFEMTSSVYAGFLIRNSLIQKSERFKNLTGARIFFGSFSSRIWRWGLYCEHLYDFTEIVQIISINSWLGFDISQNLSIFAESKWSSKNENSIDIMSRFYF